MIALFLANGFEETEALAPLDILKRAGCDICSVGIGSKEIIGSHKIKVIAELEDTELDIASIEGVILPGGLPGATNLEASEIVRACVLRCAEKGLPIGAICAAPSVLGKLGVLKGKNAVCYPGFENYLIGANVSEELVCTDGNIITAKGPGASIDFGLALVELICGKELSQTIRKEMQCR